jgi:hypothetical protein
MLNSLLNTLVQKKQREVAGSDTAARFDYQKNWAFCEMLDRHQAELDYMVAFEFHDDVLFFHSENSPSQVDFIQVKTSKKAEPRKISELTARKDGASSVVGKMIQNSSSLENDFEIRMILVSNNAFEFSDADICAGEMDTKYKQKFLSKLKEEFPEFAEDRLSKLHFRVSKIAVDHIDTFLKGRTQELFEKRFGKDFKMNVSTWIRLIQGEIKRKNNHPANAINNVEDLITHKCISKNFIEQTLSDVETHHKNVPDITWFKNQFSAHGWNFADVISFDKAYARAFADYNDPNNEECLLLQKCIAAKLNLVGTQENISDFLDTVYSEMMLASEIPAPYQNKFYVYALTVLVQYEKQ